MCFVYTCSLLFNSAEQNMGLCFVNFFARRWDCSRVPLFKYVYDVIRHMGFYYFCIVAMHNTSRMGENRIYDDTGQCSCRTIINVDKR